MEVYLDLVVLLNFLVDLLLLLGTNRLAGHPPGVKRCLGAALFGGVYGGACLLPGFRFLGNLLWRMVSLGIMGGIAFGIDFSACKRCGIFVLLSMALGGIAIRFGRGDFLALVLAGGGVWLLSVLGFGGRIGGKEYLPLVLHYEGHTERLLALRDTGNSLRDPVTGEQVFLISGDCAQRLTGLGEEDLRHPMETLARRPLPGLRLIPYRAVGCGGGMLLGLRFPEAELNGRRVSAVIAFVPEGLGSAGYQALVT